MTESASVTICGKPYGMRFTIAAYEEMQGKIPDAGDIKSIVGHMATFDGTYEVMEIMIRAAGGEAPPIDEVKRRSLVIEIARMREAAVAAIAAGMGIETTKDDDVDEGLMEVEKKTPVNG